MFKVTWLNYGELNSLERVMKSMTFDIENNKFQYELSNGDRGAILHSYDNVIPELTKIVKSPEFSGEIVSQIGHDGDFYEFDIDYLGTNIHQKGYIYGLKLHDLLVHYLREDLKDEISKVIAPRKVNKPYTIKCKNCMAVLSHDNAINSYTFKCNKCGTETVSTILKHWTEDIEGQ